MPSDDREAHVESMQDQAWMEAESRLERIEHLAVMGPACADDIDFMRGMCALVAWRIRLWIQKSKHQRENHDGE